MRKRNRKIQATVFLTALLLVLSGTAKYEAAQTGWVKDNVGWWYRYEDGGYPARAWIQDKNIWYYFGADGYMQTGWFLEEGKAWYYLDSDGGMQIGWKEIGGIWYYFYDSGAMASNAWIDTYYVDGEGAWIQPSSFADSEHAIKARMEELKVKYPQGMYWNHVGYQNVNISYLDNYYSEMITSIPCNHEKDGTQYCNSYFNGKLEYVVGLQCDGFARKLSDEIFGEDAAAKVYVYDFSEIKIGDYLRYGNAHSVIVIEKTAESIAVAEANVGSTCMISWGRVITKETLNSYYRDGSIKLFTRY